MFPCFHERPSTLSRRRGLEVSLFRFQVAALLAVSTFVTSNCFAQARPASPASTASTQKKLQSTDSPKQPEISDAFAKAAMRLVIAIKDSDGSPLAVQHVRVLDEEAEMEQATPEERAILQDLALRHIYYQLDSKMELATVSPYGGSPSQANLDAQKTYKADIDCFFAYIPTLKSLSASIPPLCLANDANRDSDSKRAEDERDKAQCDKEQRTDCKPAREQSVLERNLRVRLDLCIDATGKNGKDAKAIARCNAAYDKEMKEHGVAK